MRWIIALVIILVLEVYSFQLIRTLSKDHWWKWVYLALSILILSNLILQFTVNTDRAVPSVSRDISITIFLALLAAKAIFVLVMLGEDIFRFLEGLYYSFSQKRNLETTFLPSRRKFISQIGLSLGALPFGAILYGAWKGKYNYQVREYELSFEDLPKAFHGYKITQISDIHIGSFTNNDEVRYAVDLVNKQQSDVILFTGDLVNNEARELYGWESILGRLSAKDGVFSVLGNHDYGDYVQWDSPEKKKANLRELLDVQRQIGWQLLLDETYTLKRDGEELHIVGVQNYGGGRFPKYGNLAKASRGLDENSFKVLLSHDPSHWDLQIKDDEKKYHLTLSGHTHGMQFGFEIPGIVKWSPVSFVYKKWAGIYKEKGQFLNVNRGFGFIGYSGRAGIWPEISVITLKRAHV